MPLDLLQPLVCNVGNREEVVPVPSTTPALNEVLENSGYFQPPQSVSHSFCLRRLQIEMQELIEGALLVVTECPAFDETVPAIEVERGFEGRARAGFQRQARVASSAGLGDDVLENRDGNAASQVRIGRAHRFDFAGS